MGFDMRYEDDWLTKTGVKERGWTDAAIRDFLGEADAYDAPGGYVKTCFYRTERVKAVERSEAFRAWRQKSEKRREAAQKAAGKRRDGTMEWAQTVEIEIPTMKIGQVRQRAINHYNKRNRDKDRVTGRREAQDFLDRIQVNYIRHEMVNYERLLKQKFGRTGADEAYKVIGRRVLEKIAETYPALGLECMRKMAEIEAGRRVKTHEVEAEYNAKMGRYG